MIRTVDDLEDFAERYERENYSMFRVPNEMELVYNDDVPDIQRLGHSVCWAESPADGLRDRGGVRESQTDDGTTPEDGREGFKAPADNMGLVKYREDLFPRGWGGFDGGCEAGFYGKWENERFETLTQILDRAKQAADDREEADSYIEFGPFIWKVWPKGANCGGGKYKWVMESRGVKLYIHSNPTGSIAPFRVRFGSECLMQTDLFDAVETLKKCFVSMGFTPNDDECISRVDAQVLLPVTVQDFLDLMKPDRIITRCRGTGSIHFSLKTGALETFTIGSENCELCIYDKRAELLDKASFAYLNIFCRTVFGDENANLPEQLTRIEFRFRRAMLDRYGIRTFEDLRGSIAALLDVASSDWFRILERDKVRGSEREIKNAPLWERVRQAFHYYFASETYDRRTPQQLRGFRKLPGVPQVEKTVKQGIGCLASAASVLLEKTVQTGEEVVAFIHEQAGRFADELYQKVIERQIENEIVHSFYRQRRFDCLPEVQQALGDARWSCLLEFAGES